MAVCPAEVRDNVTATVLRPIMNMQNYLWSIFVIAATLLAACDGIGVNEGSGTVTLSGQVLDRQTDEALVGAFVQLRPMNIMVETDSSGRYRQNVEVDSTTRITVEAEKDGFGAAATDVVAIGGRSIDVPTLRLEQLVEEARESGRASTIQLIEQSVESIGVKESGAPEVATLTFQVADSMGRPVVIDNAANIQFTMGDRPNGGEFVYPSSASTNNNGRVSVNVSSGTAAGTVQLVAETEVEGTPIRSKPVSVAIHGGLPDEEHFTVAPQQVNFPGLRRYGLTNGIEVIAGDEYGNPVKPGTAVYLTTNYGVIEGSIRTNAQGRGSVELTSANPLPEDGVALVSARTADENQQRVERQTPVVFTGGPIVTIAPGNPVLGQWYRMTVTDPNGNPLVEGTTITVNVEGTKVKAVGHTNVKLDDTAFQGGFTYDDIVRGSGITEFDFKAVEDPDIAEEGTPSVESITVRISGGNGDLTVVLGQAQPAVSPTEGATVEQLPGGQIKAEVSQPPVESSEVISEIE